MSQGHEGRAGGKRVMQAPSMAGVARILVQVLPGSLENAVAAISGISGVEVSDRDHHGKLALKLRYNNAGQLAATLRKVSEVSGVTSTTLAMQTATPP